MKTIAFFSLTQLLLVFSASLAIAQNDFPELRSPDMFFTFNKGEIMSSDEVLFSGPIHYSAGLDYEALDFDNETGESSLNVQSELLKLGSGNDFTISFWLQSTMSSDEQTLIASTKDTPDLSLASQKKAGWSIGISGGTLYWNIGSGSRRLTYQRDNGEHLTLNDGKWHYLSMTYNDSSKQVWLYCDGENIAIYNLLDSGGFNFEAGESLTLGWSDNGHCPENKIIPLIKQGAEQLQTLVDLFNDLNIGNVRSDQFRTLVVNPDDLVGTLLDKSKLGLSQDPLEFFKDSMRLEMEPVMNARAELMKNPFTVFQVRNFMKVAPLFKLYRLDKGKVYINEDCAIDYSLKEKLSAAKLKIDNLAIWNHSLSAEEVKADYSKQGTVNKSTPLPSDTLRAAVWNIWHGGKHNTVELDGWDSRKKIAEMLKNEGADVIMMQETYSSGDFIAAELGYYFATTADWDYLNQGSNISVLSKYPIEELFVPEEASFMNVAAKISIGDGKKIYVMSNWYGMSSFSGVYDFHKQRFNQADSIPVLFGGDFNAVPHYDGGKSLASKVLINEKFTDAYRNLFPNILQFPGYTHQGGYRIDQLYYKGNNLKNNSTKVVSTHPGGYPSDHFMIFSEFIWDANE